MEGYRAKGERETRKKEKIFQQNGTIPAYKAKGDTMDKVKLLREKKYSACGSKRDLRGHLQDEVVMSETGEYSVWFYHGNPIVILEHETGEYHYSSCGWETSTTKERLRDAGCRVHQYKHVWYMDDGEKFKDDPVNDALQIAIARDVPMSFKAYGLPSLAKLREMAE